MKPASPGRSVSPAFKLVAANPSHCRIAVDSTCANQLRYIMVCSHKKELALRYYMGNGSGDMRTLIIFALLAVGYSTTVGADTTDEQQQQAAALANKFVSMLKPQLKQAMAEGGPTHAIAVCTDIAPGIADALSGKSGWSVRRVSLKSRNASRAIPDDWERNVLLNFDRRQAAGDPASDLHVGEVVSGQYRYMQAQVVEPLCLACHGEALAEDVQEILQEYYPDDWATGYKLGEVRGAISVSGDL